MTDKHLTVSLEHQIWQSRRVKNLTAENNRLKDTLKNLIKQYKTLPKEEFEFHLKNIEETLTNIKK